MPPARAALCLLSAAPLPLGAMSVAPAVAPAKITPKELQEAAKVLKEFSLGISRVPLEKMACATFNRNGLGVNGAHAHSVFKLIKEQGMVLWRYQHGYCIQPHPDRPMEHARFTNSYVEKQRGMLAPVADKPLLGSFGKTHLWHALYTAKCGTVKLQGTDLPMVTVPADEEMEITADQGLFLRDVEVGGLGEAP